MTTPPVTFVAASHVDANGDDHLIVEVSSCRHSRRQLRVLAKRHARQSGRRFYLTTFTVRRAVEGARA